MCFAIACPEGAHFQESAQRPGIVLEYKAFCCVLSLRVHYDKKPCSSWVGRGGCFQRPNERFVEFRVSVPSILQRGFRLWGLGLRCEA